MTAQDAPEVGVTQDAVLISGAGPSGLALALSLASSGVAVRLIDKASGPATTSRAIGVQPRTLEMLEPFGLAQAFADLGCKARAGNIYARSQSRRLVRTDLTKLPGSHPYLLFLVQTETERLLTEALAKLGVHVEHGVEVASFEQSEASVRVSLRRDGGEIGQADFAYLAGCDGAHSSTRRQLDLHFEGKTLRQGFMLADLDIESDLANDEYHVFASPGGLVAIFPLTIGHRLIVEMEDSAAAGATTLALADFREIVARRIDVPLRLSELRWSSYFQINSRITSSLQRDRIFLVGDAAHIHSPAGAQGMNTGMQDAFNLGWKLAFVMRGEASPALLRTYEAERHPVERDVLRRTEAMQRTVTLKSPFLRFWRDRIVPRMSALPRAQRDGRLAMSQLGITYRAQASAHRGAAPNGLHAGDRVPDAWIAEDARSAPRRLHPSLDTARFTLLVIRQGADRHGSITDPGATFSPDRRVTTMIGSEVSGPGLHGRSFAAREDRFYLIRPDGYLALHGALPKLGDVATYLHELRNG